MEEINMKMVKKALSYLVVLVLIVTAITSTGVVANATMLPLKEKNVYLLLADIVETTGVDPSKIPVQRMLDCLMDTDGNFISIDKDATVVWSYVKDDEGNVIKDEYHKINRNETVDLSSIEDETYTLELIVGSGNQLDPNNTRYIVRVYLTQELSDYVTYEVYKQSSDGTRTKIDTSTTENDASRNILYKEHVQGTEYYVGINSDLAQHPLVTTKVYLQTLFSATDITDQILNVDMTKPNAGYKTTLDAITLENWQDTKYFRIIFTNSDDGSVLKQLMTNISVTNDKSYVEGRLFDSNMNSVEEWESGSAGLYEDDDKLNDVFTKTYMLKEGLSSSDEYYYVLNAHSSVWTEEANNYVVKAVTGLHSSYSEAASLTDIKDQLIPTTEIKATQKFGYKATYNNGQTFTVYFKKVGHEDDTSFNDSNVDIWRFKVTVIDYDRSLDTKYHMQAYSDAPIVGAADPWFRVNGVKSGNSDLDVYVVENGKAINMDTLYGYGYQTLFVNDKNVNLTNVKPTFWFGDADRVETYVGSKQESGVSSQDFLRGAVQYSTIIDDHVKNYQVNIVKKQSGAKLYVNGPSTREIFLDEYFEYKHDILVANIGDAPLTGLKVELNAENVKLDDYWTIGGSNNDTLAAFTTTETSSKYGELANIGKIRLLPDGDGDVSGTLKISADGQEPVIINLSGRASNPEIITKKLDDAVKYVPYSYVVATNNMNDWNDVTFSREAGSLPEGLQLYPKTGEIYGVPKESGTYNITVKATYSRDDYFEPSYADLTLVVKDNTNDNVYNTSDEGYAIKVHLGTETENSHEFLIENIEEDQPFVSNGELDEFMALWLNGEELEEGVDYTKKSGSTKLTIKSQTFENKANKDGNNTIAMEYRKNGNRDEDLRRTSQNFIVENKSQTDSAVENVISLINSIPAVSNLTLNDKSQVQSARSAYNSLNSSQKGKVTNYSKLTNAESQIKSLEEQEAADRAEAQKVINLINKIPGSISIKDKPTVQTARNGYDGLTYPQKEYVTNYSKLVSAENTISNIEGYISAAQPVIDKIDAIPNQIALENKDLVTTARTAYDKLIAKQKEYVTNYAKLTAAESAIATLELKPDDAKKKIDISDSDKDRKDVNDIKETVADNGTGNNGNSNGQTSSGSNGAIQTGDKNNLAVWYLLLILSWSSLIAMFIRYSKEKKSNVLF